MLRKGSNDNITPKKRGSVISYYKDEKEKEKNIKVKKDDKILSKAYKNVINVITNILDNHNNEEQQTKEKEKNGRFSNLKKNNKSFNFKVNKNPIQKGTSHNKPHRVMFLSKLSSKCNDSFCSWNSKQQNLLFLNTIKSPEKFFCSEKELLNENNKLILDEEVKNELKKNIKRISVVKNAYFTKRNSKRVIILSGKNPFFKPKNKLKFGFGFRRSLLVPKSFKKETDKSLSYYSGLYLSTNTKISEKSISFQKSKYRGRGTLKKGTQKTLSIIKDVEEPFNCIQQKLNINIDAEKIQQRLYDYENNEITSQINMLPGNSSKQQPLVKRNALAL